MQISLKNVYYTYNYKIPYAREVLKDVNLEIEEGSYTVIVGKTGSGKSTLIEHINGLLLPTHGEVMVNNVLIKNPKNKKEKRSLAKILKTLRQDVAVLFQFSEQQLFETSVLKDIIFAPLNYGVAEEKAILYADKVFVLKNGEISFEGKVEDLFLNEKILMDNSLELPEVLKFYQKLEASNIILDIFPRKYEDLVNALKNKIGSSKNE